MSSFTTSQRDDTTSPKVPKEQSRRKAREILNGMSHYRIDPVEIKRKDDTVPKRGGQGFVTVGTLRLSAKAQEFVSLLNKSADWAGATHDELNNPTPEFKEYLVSKLKEWPLGIRAALEMAGTPPETLEGWIPEIKVAVKMLEWSGNDDEESTKFFKSFVHELSLMAQLSHPNIIQLVGFVEGMEKGSAWIVMPWEANGNVREFLQSGQWDLPERISLIQDTAKGLEYLHTRQPPICHGDLKSLNILVDFSHQAVITDFGSARIKQHVPPEERENASVRPQGAPLDHGTSAEWTSPEVTFRPSTFDFTLTGPRYSLRWTAPEVIRGDDQDLPSDVWAIGWIAWEIVTGKMPFEELNTEGAIIHHTVMGKLPAIREDADLSHVLKLCSLMSDCWHLVPGKRIDASAFQRKVDLIPSVTPSGAESGDGGQKERSAQLLAQLGQTYSLQGDLETAMSYYQSAMDVATRTGDEIAKANVLSLLGDGYRNASKNAEAEQAFMEARDIFSRYCHEEGIGRALGGLGMIYCSQAKYNLAEKVLSDAHQLFSRSGDNTGTGDALVELAKIYQLHSKYCEAEKACMTALELQSRLGHDLGAANALDGLGMAYRAQSKYCEAENAFMEAHEIYSRVGNRHGAAAALRELGDTYRMQSRFQEAEKAFNNAYRAHPPDTNCINAASHFYGLEMLYHDQGRQNEAEACYRQALAVSHRAGEVDARAQTLLSLGELYHAQARYSDAEEAAAEALAIGISLENDPLQGRAHSLLAQIFASQSQHPEELESLIQAERSLARIGPHDEYAATLVGLAAAHVEQDMYAEAEDYFRHAQAIFLSVKDASGETCVLLALGALYLGQGRDDEAEECFAQTRITRAAVSDEGDRVKGLDKFIASSALLRRSGGAKVACMEACEFLSRTGEHTRHADTLKHLGGIHTEEGTYGEAEESYRHAQSIFLSIKDARGEAGVLFDLGALYSHQDRYAEAEECFAQARVAYAMVADEDGEAKALNKLITAYVLQRKFDDARVACTEGCELLCRTGQHALLANTLKHLGNIYTEEGTYVEAEESYRHAQSIFSSIKGAGSEAGVLFGLGVLYGRQGRYAEAEECFAQARVAFAMVADEDGEANALDNLMRAYFAQQKFDDVKVALKEGCEMYAQRGQPVSLMCALIGVLVPLLERSPLAREHYLQALSSLNMGRL